MAEDEQTVERIEDGDIASAERKRNETILNHIRNQGTECELKKTAIYWGILLVFQPFFDLNIEKLIASVTVKHNVWYFVRC